MTDKEKELEYLKKEMKKYEYANYMLWKPIIDWQNSSLKLIMDEVIKRNSI